MAAERARARLALGQHQQPCQSPSPDRFEIGREGGGSHRRTAPAREMTRIQDCRATADLISSPENARNDGEEQ